ncbi:MAG: serpin family protein [Planctomycetes bacterium]|nr:serpin family protein [Planctomycetota bacterium]
MKKPIAFAIGALVVLIAAAKAGPPDRHVDKLVAGNNAFAFDLYGHLAKDPKATNLVLSPYSISMPLAMTYGGAAGDTAKEMARTLHLTIPADDVHRSFASLLAREKAVFVPKGYELNLANSLWAQQGFAFRPEFLDLTRDKYFAGLKELNFATATEQSRKTINKWVEERTNQKIKELLRHGTIDSETRLVLTNAVYLKGEWTLPFDKNVTREKPFHVTPSVTVPVPMMAHRERFLYAEDDEMQLLDLPIGKRGVSVLIALPKKADGLANLEKSFTQQRFENLRRDMAYKAVIVEVPRFKITSEFNLAKTLVAMGMPSAFGAKADFSGMAKEATLYISAVIHKAFLDVHEKGIEAAAATAVVIREGSLLTNIVFRADHPFLYIIRENSSGSILFFGRLTHPGG